MTAPLRPDSYADLLDALGGDLGLWSRQCHAASIRLVRSGTLPPDARVARGTCPGVTGQHSWVVLGGDCYDLDAPVIDPTLWSYRDDVDGIWTGTARTGGHRPHGYGNIMEWGKPQPGDGPRIDLAVPVSRLAEFFLELLGPLDRTGWMTLLSHAPVGGWPAAEIVSAAYRTPALSALIPIDRVGMLTHHNPSRLYLAGPERDDA